MWQLGNLIFSFFLYDSCFLSPAVPPLSISLIQLSFAVVVVFFFRHADGGTCLRCAADAIISYADILTTGAKWRAFIVRFTLFF